MALLFAQSADGQTISIPAGTHAGHVRLTRHDCVFRGAGIDTTRIVADGQLTQLFQAPFPPQTPDRQPVRSVTIRDVTLDAGALANLTAVVLSHPDAGPLRLTLENVRIRNTHRNTVGISAGRETVVKRCEVVGNGGGIKVGLTATSTVVRGLHCRGGLFGLVVADGAVGTIPGIDVDGLTSELDYWAATSWEPVRPLAYGPRTVDVASHVVDHRALYDVLRVLTPIDTYDTCDELVGVERWDRLEMSDGRWTQVLGVVDGVAQLDEWRGAGTWNPIATGAGIATVYRVSLGRLMSWTPGRLSLTSGNDGSGVPALAHWRSVEGRDVGTPVVPPGSRLDILRKGVAGGPRDVDTGGIHITGSARDARLRRCRVRGGWSDMITTRGPGTQVRTSCVDLGQDMGFTVDGRNGSQELIGCHACRGGFMGFWLGGGPSRLVSCVADDNGLHADGIAGYGVRVEADASGSVVNVSGRGNLLGLVGGPGASIR